MKKNLLLLTGLLLAMVAHTQQPYEPMLSLTKFERSVRGEVEADVNILAETATINIHIKTPVYLNYNLNDIRMFSIAPFPDGACRTKDN